MQSQSLCEDGFAFVIATPEGGRPGIGIVIELKYADEGNLEEASLAALERIEEMHYADDLLKKDEDIHTIIRYGVGCCKERCQVMMGTVPNPL